ncbi:hypothetical protein ACTA71_004714 [Dictyostelium dimigraforme]
MKEKIFLLILISTLFVNIVLSSGKYNGPQYLNGINAGYKSGWSNSDLGPLMGEAAIRSQRMKFPCTFFQTWGYKILYDNDSFGSSKRAGQSNFTAFITYNQSDDSRVPSSIYEPIWINGKVNPANEFAYCVSQIVNTYKNDVKIYEIYNEPDWVSDWTVVSTWATNPPTAAQMVRFQGDIFTYVRLLRISWEVAKSIDPTCFITVGGLGYPLFLDAVLRYGENSSVTNPSLFGKNYIDAISTHFYPMYGTSKTNSDAYLSAYIDLQNNFRKVTNKYNFHPSIWIVTETGVATKSGTGYYGSSALARNYFLKLPSISTSVGVCQNHIFILGDTNSGTNAFANMGLFYDYQNVAKNKALLKDSSKSLVTWDHHLFGKTLDTSKNLTSLPAGVISYAYSDSNSTCYFIWANSTNFGTDEETAPIEIQLSAEFASVYNYSNEKKTISSSNGKVKLIVDSTPQFVYLNYQGPDSGENPSNSPNISFSFNLIILTIIINFIFFF